MMYCSHCEKTVHEANHVCRPIKFTRRFFFGILGAAVSATFVKTDSLFVPEIAQAVVTPSFDVISSITLNHLRRDIIADNFFRDAAWHKLIQANSIVDGGTEIRCSVSYQP